MHVEVSFPKGVPLLVLRGRFDGPGAAVVDREVLGLRSGAAHWVIDLSGVDYLSSVGVRSLVTLEKRLKLLEGGVILVGMSTFVGQVLRLSGLDGLLRTAATASDGVTMAHASAAVGPVEEHALAACRAQVRLLPEGCSAIEWWSPEAEADADSSAARLLGANLGDLGFAFGTGLFGETPADAGAALGAFVSSPHLAGAVAAEAHGVSDFVVGDASARMPVHVSQALGVSGSPAAVAELSSATPFSLVEGLDELFDVMIAGARPPVLGFVVVGEDVPNHQGVLVTGVAFSPRDAQSTLDRDGHLAGWPGQMPLASGRSFVGGVVTVEGLASVAGRNDLDSAVRSLATLDVLRDVMSLGECRPVTRATAWVFVPDQVRRGADKLLQVIVEGGGEWRREWDAIVRQLYSDCRSVTVAPLHGGYMSKTFRVVAYDRDGRRTLPTVLKLGPTALTAREQQANRDYVSRFILNNGTTVLGEAEQGAWAGLRYNFVGINGPDSQLVWLRQHYLDRPVPEFLGLFEQLFTRVLKPWYAQPKWEEVFLYQDHTPLRLFPTLIEVAERELHLSADTPDFDCPELGCRLPNPFHFLKHEYPRRATKSRLWYTAICHGDLNLQNVLVDERDNLYVIDFSETRPRNAVSDFARIEPILKFEMTRLETDEDLRRLVEFEEGLTRVTRLDELPPLRYHGNDPMVARAHAGIAYLRRCADRATLFEQDIVPYWLALLEWTFSVVCYMQLSLRHKRYAACSAALICRSIQQLEQAG